MIPETTLENDSLPLAFRHLVVNQPPDRERNAAKDQQRAKGLEDQSNQPRVHRAIVALPNNAAFHAPDRAGVASGNSVHRRHFLQRLSGFADFRNLLSSESARMVLLTVLQSPFVPGIKPVIFLRARRQVPRIHASRVIARVHQHQARRNLPAKQDVAVSVRKNVFSVQRHQAIAGLSFSGSPKPAGICFLNPAHENFICADGRKVIKTPGVSGAVITSFAKPATVRRLPTLQARRFDSLVSHINLLCGNYNRNQGVIL